MQQVTLGLSPKVLRPFVVAVVGWVITKLGLGWDPDACAAVVLALITAVGYHAPAGNVAVVSDPASIPKDKGDKDAQRRGR